MNSFVQQRRENQGRASADRDSRKGSEALTMLQPADDRPTAVAQRALDQSLNRSARVQSQLQLQQMVNQSPRVVAQMKLAEALTQRRSTEHAQTVVQRLDSLEDEEMVQREASLEEEEPLQAKSEPVQREAIDEEEPLQGKFEPLQRETMPEEEEPVQAKPEPVQKQENKTGLPDNLKAGVENLSGIAMDDVKVHYNSAAPAQMQALAYTQGSEIHVGPGQEKHLAHEAWHVAQQKQGRVQPTVQAKDMAINDDRSLETEADVMGEKAAQATAFVRTQHDADEASPKVVKASGLSAAQPIQAKFVKLTEARILYVQQQQKAQGEDVDAEYLQGLWETETDQTAGEHGNPNPALYIQVAKVAPRYVYDDSMRGDTPLVKLYANVDKVDEAEVKAARMDEGRNVLQILRDELPMYTLKEEGPFTPAQIQASIERQAGKLAGESQVNDILNSVMTGGVVEDTDQGGYGSIEFRFKDAEGEFYIEQSIYKTDGPSLMEKYPRVSLIPASQSEIDQFRLIYQQAGLPYAAERTGPKFVFVERTQAGKFRTAFEESGTLTGVQSQPANLTATDPGVLVKPLPAAPLAVPKQRTKNYTRRAVRGSRDGGQKGAMANYSAHDYVQQFNNAAAAAHSWEWLHIQGARLGGPNRPENLVAGTSEANTQMIPYERAIYRLSTVATPQKTVDANWSATVKQDNTNANTQIGDRITMDVNFPQGAPPATEEVNPQEIKSVFPVTVNAVEGAEFTKLDRGIAERRMKP